MTVREAGPVRRVLVEILGEADVRFTAAQAEWLARLFDAEIEGVLLEEAGLAQIAVGVEIGRTSGRAREISAEALALDQRRRLRIARRRFEALALSTGRRARVEAAAGRAGAAAHRAGRHDIVLFTGSAERLVEPGLLAALREAAARSLAIAISGERAAPAAGPVWALMESPESAERARPVLERIAAGSGSDLRIRIVSPQGAMADLLAGMHATRRDPAGGRPRLIVGEAGLLLAAEARPLREVLRRIGCPVLCLNIAAGGTSG